MKKTKLKVLMASLGGFLLLGSIVNINLSAEKVYRYGEYVPEENAYFVERIDDPAGLIKAHKFVTPTDNKYNSQKTRSLGTSLIGDIESVWSAYTGKGTTVAIIDDGFDYDHPEYTRADGSSAILSTSRYYYASGNTAYYKSYSSDPTCIAEDWEEDDDLSDGDDSEWATHGTNTSTTAAAPMNNGGGVGIAPDADILALKVDFQFVSLRAAIQYAIDQGVDVINMSLGAYAESFVDGWGDNQSGYSSSATYLNSVCQSAYDAGIIVVAAAGNESTWHKSYPACNSHVIGVGALGDWHNKGNADALAEFTNYVGEGQTGEINVDILAPGYVYTATQGGTSSSSHTHTYSDTQGTSFSCPIIAGAACLWKQKYPNGTPDEFLNKLQTSADGIGEYANKMVPVSGWYSSLSDVGPSNITNGRLNVANLMDIDEPFVSTVQSSFNIVVGESKQIQLDTFNGSISYSSSNADVVTVSNSGLIEGVAAGEATITVTASKNEHTATAEIPVSVAPIVACETLTFNPDSITLSVGDTYEAEPTIAVTPENASRIFLFESENESVATVDEDTGTITAVSEGTANINAVAVNGDGDDTLVVTVEAPVTPTSWDKVTSSSQLTDGDYLIVYEAGNLAFNGGLETLDANEDTIAVSISNSKITYSAATEAAKFTIRSMEGGYSIQAANGKYIYGTSGSNILNSGDSPVANAITIGGGDADIVSNTSHLRFNTDGSRFRYYKSSSYANQQAIQLYKGASSGGGEPVPTVSSVTVTPSTLALDIYSEPNGVLSAVVNGDNSPAQTVTWSSANSSIATVNSNGVVVAKGVGTTTIKATSTVDTTKFGTCTVTVADSTPKTLSSISISGYETNFSIGDTFSFGGTVTAHYSNSSSEDVTASSTFSGYDMSKAGSQTVTVSYTYEGTTKTATYQIYVSDPALTRNHTIGWGNATGTEGTYTNFAATSGSVTDILSFTTAKNGSTNDPAYNSSSKELRLYYSSTGNGGSITIAPAEGITLTGFSMHTSTTPNVRYKVDGGDATSVSASNSTYTASGFHASSSLMIQNANTSNVQLRIDTIALAYEVPDESDKIVDHLTANYSGGDVYVGDSLDTSKVTVTASYINNEKYHDAVLPSSEYSLTGFDSETSGNKTVTVTYTGSLSTASTPLTTSFLVSVIDDTITNVVATVSKTYHPGETIAKGDITVTLTYASGKSGTTTDFTFASDGYAFTYADAPSGGSAGSKQFSIVYAGETYQFSANVSRVAYVAPSASTLTLTGAQLVTAGITGTGASSAADYDSLTVNGVTYAAKGIYIYNNYISFGKGEGEIHNTTPLSKPVTSLSITTQSGSRTDGILSVSEDGSTWVEVGEADFAGKDYRYIKVAFEGTSTKYSNFTPITIGQRNADTCVNVVNYIMFEDTENQCTSKLDLAISKLNSMSNEDKSAFWSSEDYVIVSARNRLLAWAAHEGKSVEFSNGNITLSLSSAKVAPSSGTDNSSAAVLILSLFSLALIGTSVFLLVKRKTNKA